MMESLCIGLFGEEFVRTGKTRIEMPVEEIESPVIGMFEGTRFNQDVRNWNTRGWVSINSMFRNTRLFDQSLGDWDIEYLKDADKVLEGAVDFSTESYDATLIGWAAQAPKIRKYVILGVGSVQFSEKAIDARNLLINVYSWIIKDGGLKIN